MCAHLVLWVTGPAVREDDSMCFKATACLLLNIKDLFSLVVLWFLTQRDFSAKMVLRGVESCKMLYCKIQTEITFVVNNIIIFLMNTPWNPNSSTVFSFGIRKLVTKNLPPSFHPSPTQLQCSNGSASRLKMCL